jgi:hypothetical protein
MAKREHRKLVDVPGSMEAARQAHNIIQQFLIAQEIQFSLQHAADPYGREYWRYKVHAPDLSRARAVLPALEELGARVRGAI